MYSCHGSTKIHLLNALEQGTTFYFGFPTESRLDGYLWLPEDCRHLQI